MVGHNDSRALHLEVLQSLHLKPQAEEILEGPDNSSDDSAEKKSSQQQGREGRLYPVGVEGDKKSSRTENLQSVLCSTQVSALHGLNAPGRVCDLSCSVPWF